MSWTTESFAYSKTMQQLELTLSTPLQQGVADAEQQVNQSDGNAALTSREDQEVGSPHQENPNN